MDTSLHADAAPAEPTPPVNVLVSFENPIGILRNCRAALALLSTLNLEEDAMPSGSDMGHWLILQSVMQALQHAEKLLMTEARENPS